MRACSPVLAARAGPLLAFLRGLGLAPDATPSPVITASDRLLVEFEEYLLGDRGLPARTVEGYRSMAGLFLASRCAAAGDDLQLGSLTAADVSAFMLEQSALRSAGSLGKVITELRALLRFLYLRQYAPLPLAAAVPAVCAAHRAGASRTPPPATWRGCWPAAIGARRSAAAITRS